MNRGRMMEALGGAMAAAERENSACAFLVIAVTNLSAVNEAYGFEVADEVILGVGQAGWPAWPAPATRWRAIRAPSSASCSTTAAARTWPSPPSASSARRARA